MASDPLHDIAHLGSVELFTPEPERSLWFFRELLGMTAVHDSCNSAYLRGYGDYAASTLKLTASVAPGVGRVAWRTTSGAALERQAAALEATRLGIGCVTGGFVPRRPS